MHFFRGGRAGGRPIRRHNPTFFHMKRNCGVGFLLVEVESTYNLQLDINRGLSVAIRVFSATSADLVAASAVVFEASAEFFAMS